MIIKSYLHVSDGSSADHSLEVCTGKQLCHALYAAEVFVTL